MKLVAIRDADELLVQEMLAPLPLEQARSSLEFWRERRKVLPLYRRRERREADEMIHRWRARVAAAERARFGTGLLGQIRRRLALEPLSWPLPRERALFGFLWSILPRRIALVAVASLGAFFITTVGIGLGLTILVLHAV
jgi:hypothetical protein